jgi:predicted dehydrogenase
LTSLAEADRIVAASRKVKVLMAYLLRFVPSYVEVRDAMQRGAIGRLKSGFYSTRMPFELGASLAGTDGIASPAELADPGVGRLLDHEAHFADFFRWFSGSEPISVIATVGSSVCPELQINDYGIATYTLDNGATVTLESTRHVALDGASPPLWGPDRATVTGTKGEIEFHYQQLPQIEIQGGDGEWPRRYADEFSRGRSQDVYRNLLIEFRDIIAEDREPSPSAADGRAALEMVLAAHEAANTRRRVSFPYTADRHSAHATGSLQTHRAAI